MKKHSDKWLREIQTFIAEPHRVAGRKAAPVQPLVSWNEIRAELIVARKNILLALNEAAKRAASYRKRIDELVALEKALDGLSVDSRDILNRHAADATLQATGGAVALYNANAPDVIHKAAARAVKALKAKQPKQGKRGTGKFTSAQRQFLRAAVDVYLLAGFSNIGASGNTLFLRWLRLLENFIGEPVAGGKIRDAVAAEFGKTAGQRKRYAEQRQNEIRRRYRRPLEIKLLNILRHQADADDSLN